MSVGRRISTIKLYIEFESKKQKGSAHRYDGHKYLSVQSLEAVIKAGSRFPGHQGEKGARVRSTVLILKGKKPTGQGNSLLTWKPKSSGSCSR